MSDKPRTRTFHLPDGIRITVVPLDGTADTALLKAAAYHASLYLLAGKLTGEHATEAVELGSPNWGVYVGMSAELQDRLRAGVSLREWSTAREVLQPRLAVLIDRTHDPLPTDVIVLAETLLIRALFATDRWRMLNSTAGCPTVAGRLPRHQTAYTLHLVGRLMKVLDGRALPRDVGPRPTFGAHAGPIREQLLRLVRVCGQPMTSSEVVAEAVARGIPIAHHGQPAQTARRDLTTRERQGARGPVRVHHTHLRGPSGRHETLFYPPGLSRSAAVNIWHARHGSVVYRLRAPRRPYRPAA